MTFPYQAGIITEPLRRWLKVCVGVAWIWFSAGLPAQTPPGADPAAASSRASSTNQSVPVQAVGASAPLANPIPLSPSIVTPADITNPPVPPPTPSPAVVFKPVASSVPATIVQFLAETNGLPKKAMSRDELLAHLSYQFEVARYLRVTRQPGDAEPLLIDLLARTSPEPIQQSALLELAAVAQDQNNLTRAQEIYSQFLGKWPNDLRVPEILLREGVLFRQMGLANLAFVKFYAVMTSALVMKNDQLDYYVRLVLQAQIEIAETQYELGRYGDAAEFFSRLLKQNNPAIDKSQIIFKLTRCHSALGQYTEAVSDAQEFLARYPDAPEQPEIRFHLALALKELGRNSESLQQVLMLLQEQRVRTRDHPELWAYWQQRAGNLIANELYREGDYAKALEIYLNLARLDPSLLWQVPVNYQIGMTYERLWQPQKATEIYSGILAHENELGTNTPPELKTVFEMARWRTHFIQWQNHAETANRQLHAAVSTDTSVAGGLPAAPTAIP